MHAPYLLKPRLPTVAVTARTCDITAAAMHPSACPHGSRQTAWYAPRNRMLKCCVHGASTRRGGSLVVNCATPAAHADLSTSTAQRVSKVQYPSPIVVLELFSGIGGMRYALQRALGHDQPLHVKAIDINQVANKVYEHSFKDRPETRNLAQCTPQQLDAYHADLWCMSPPCQPYTTTTLGKRRDTADPRAASFTHLLRMLPDMKHPPRGILLENVTGFVGSDGHTLLLQTLHGMGYHVQQFVVGPEQFGIPYLRPRCFVLASSTPFVHVAHTGPGPATLPPPLPLHLALRCMSPAFQKLGLDLDQYLTPAPGFAPHLQLVLPRAALAKATTPNVSPAVQFLQPINKQAASAQPPHMQSNNSTPTDSEPQPMDGNQQPMVNDIYLPRQTPEGTEMCLPLGHFLDHFVGFEDDRPPASAPEAEVSWQAHELGTAKLAKFWKVLDCVTTDSRHCNCVTKHYGRNVLGAGSVLVSRQFARSFCRLDNRGRLHMPKDPFLAAEQQQLQQAASSPHGGQTHLATGLLRRIRYLTPVEVARLHGLPEPQQHATSAPQLEDLPSQGDYQHFPIQAAHEHDPGAANTSLQANLHGIGTATSAPRDACQSEGPGAFPGWLAPRVTHVSDGSSGVLEWDDTLPSRTIQLGLLGNSLSIDCVAWLSAYLLRVSP